MLSHWALNSLDCVVEQEAGSFEQLFAFRHRDVISVPRPSGAAPSPDPIIVKAGAQVYRYTFPPDVLGVQERPAGGIGGYHTIQVRSLRRSLTPDDRHEVAKLSPGRYILVHVDANHQVRVLGTPDRPMAFRAGTNTGTSDADQHGTDWEFLGVQIGPALYQDPAQGIPYYAFAASACNQLVASDWVYSPWLYDLQDNQLVGIWVEPNPGGLINSISGYPAGILYDPQGGLAATLSYNVIQGYYEPDSAPLYLTPGTWQFVVVDVPVVVGDSACTLSFQQSDTVASNPAGGFPFTFPFPLS